MHLLLLLFLLHPTRANPALCTCYRCTPCPAHPPACMPSVAVSLVPFLIPPAPLPAGSLPPPPLCYPPCTPPPQSPHFHLLTPCQGAFSLSWVASPSSARLGLERCSKPSHSCICPRSWHSYWFESPVVHTPRKVTIRRCSNACTPLPAVVADVLWRCGVQVWPLPTCTCPHAALHPCLDPCTLVAAAYRSVPLVSRHPSPHPPFAPTLAHVVPSFLSRGPLFLSRRTFHFCRPPVLPRTAHAPFPSAPAAPPLERLPTHCLCVCPSS